MKHALKFVIVCIFTFSVGANASDFKTEEVIKLLEGKYPEAKGRFVVEYDGQMDKWHFKLKRVESKNSILPVRRIPNVDLSGWVKDDRKNPEILQFMEG